jgi:hypothetical protein
VVGVSVGVGDGVSGIGVKVGIGAVGVGLGLGVTTGCRQAERVTATTIRATALLIGTTEQG